MDSQNLERGFVRLSILEARFHEGANRSHKIDQSLEFAPIDRFSGFELRHPNLARESYVLEF